ncbi:iron-sulfur cluster binding protein [Legionella beliardensis]|uniref:Iron-sulfur cluster binding protein n=1 Tax=Legionella beliardensis TaxID=91822 RepID=A0A378I5T1_9GAMM|nr:RnfABCDGE type electron transport complex subunit B [Legionella beliardensis]STX30212.1 iron-sulfur cluster binding protein [Legionella beliardensis]
MTVSIDKLDAVLPQTQCGECGFSGCMPYAEALIQGSAPINLCPPGGEQTVIALANLLQIDATPYLDAAKANKRAPSVAQIHEADCVGCTKCIQACPVDAIAGSAKLMHVILTTECTGCGLCVEPCPVDCIEMQVIDKPTYDRNLARERFQAKKVRELREQHEQQQHYREKKQLAQRTQLTQEIEAKQNYILQALNRVNDKKKNHG